MMEQGQVHSRFEMIGAAWCKPVIICDLRMRKMRNIYIGPIKLEVPVVAVGCMRINSLSVKAAEKFIQTALDLKANFLTMPIYTAMELVKKFLRRLST